MYMRRFAIKNIRSISNIEMDFLKGEEPGWHVILGTNGAGKSSVVRSFALLVMGEKEAYAARQDFSRWLKHGIKKASIEGSFSMDRNFDTLAGGGNPPSRLIQGSLILEKNDVIPGNPVGINYTGERIQRTIWGQAQGWFSASFGPFRRFTGGDRIYDRLFVSNRRLAPHLSALGEDVALTEALSWLTSLHIEILQNEKSAIESQAKSVLDLVKTFINDSNFLPHGARITEITNDAVLLEDGNGSIVSLDQLSDGYRSAMSLALELIRQMFELYGYSTMHREMSNAPGFVKVPGVVAIDEVDAHLHPTWQRDIGVWLTKRFPLIQFIVTTHSPIVCRAILQEDGAMKGSVWKLPAPGSSDSFSKVEGSELDQLLYGDVLDAFDTGLFGSDLTRSQPAKRKVKRLAELNVKALSSELNAEEQNERKQLRFIFPSLSGSLEG
jgi:energy-coupling factor transporter ATP-binding protein EcfA2